MARVISLMVLFPSFTLTVHLLQFVRTLIGVCECCVNAHFIISHHKRQLHGIIVHNANVLGWSTEGCMIIFSCFSAIISMQILLLFTKCVCVCACVCVAFCYIIFIFINIDNYCMIL